MRAAALHAGLPFALALGLGAATAACKKETPVAPGKASAPAAPVASSAAKAPSPSPAPAAADPAPPPLPPLNAGPTARFVSVAALKKQGLFAPFAEFVESDDDLEESSSDAAGDEDEEASPDRPPSDLQITRLSFPGELYLFSYEENCGEDLEDKRNLQQVLLERRALATDGGAPAPSLVEVYRKRLCGESEKGFALEPLRLTAQGPELLVRTWILDPDGASEHTLRAFRPSPEGLRQVGVVRDAVDGALRFDASYPRAGQLSHVEVGASVRDEDGGERRQVVRYALGPSGFTKQEAPSRPTAPAARPAAAPAKPSAPR